MAGGERAGVQGTRPAASAGKAAYDRTTTPGGKGGFEPDSRDAAAVLFRVFPPGDDGLPVPFLLGGQVTLGRSPGGPDHVTLDDLSASRSHAVLRRCSPGPYVVKDDGSRNGVFVNGERVATRVVTDGDVIRLGDTLFVLRVVPPDLPPPLPESAGFVAVSPPFRVAVEACRAAARTKATVLLCGETGTGKEVLAGLLHRESGRPGKLVPVNCAAIAAGVFEAQMFGYRRGAFTGAATDFSGHVRAARGGTLFLDEIGELEPEVQAKLLRFLDSGEAAAVGEAEPVRVDVRVVAATNRDLATAIAEGRFRKDLHARIARWTVRLPPLRERPEDALLLCSRTLAPCGIRLDADAAEAVLVHDWPYNAREVLSACEELAIRSAGPAPVGLAALPEAVTSRLRAARAGAAAGDAGEPAAAAPTRDELARLLGETGGNVSEIARRLGKHRAQIYRWLARHGLKERDPCA